MHKGKFTPIPNEVLYGSERSLLFWMLYAHHAKLSEQWKTNRVDWSAVCKWAVENESWDRNGSPPSPNTAKKTWERVCLKKRREAETRSQSTGASDL